MSESSPAPETERNEEADSAEGQAGAPQASSGAEERAERGAHPKPVAGSDPDFDHGGFWDFYSDTWEDRYQGQKFLEEGEVLGAEWGEAEEAREIIEKQVAPFLHADGDVLEIGPGGGKFSRLIEPLCRELVLVDVSQRMLDRAQEVCRPGVKTQLIDGTGLQPVANNSMRTVVSLDVFIHLEAEEFTRYLADIHRVLEPGGHFVVNTATLESVVGQRSFFAAIRDHLGLVGQRYGGRMYPLTLSTVESLAYNLGFTVVDRVGDWENKFIGIALKKTGPCWAWRFVCERGLTGRWELGGRLGGTDEHQLFGGARLMSYEPCTLVLGDPDDPFLALLADSRGETPRGVPPVTHAENEAAHSLVEYPWVPGLSLARAAMLSPELSRSARPDGRLLAKFVRLVANALAEGWSAPRLSPESVLVDMRGHTIVPIGWIEDSHAWRGGAEAARKATVGGLRRVLEAVSACSRQPQELLAVAASVGEELDRAEAQEIARRLLRLDDEA